jgi:cytoskeleton protein RodZ
MIEDFGKYLRSEREMRGIPLEEIAESTKIQKRFLEALETNYYEVLPGEIFVRGFVHSYAKAIGADIEEILGKFDETVGHKRKGEIQKGELGKNQTYLRNRKTYRFIGVIVIVLIFGGVGFSLSKVIDVFNGPQVSSSKPAVVEKSQPSAILNKESHKLKPSKLKLTDKKQSGLRANVSAAIAEEAPKLPKQPIENIEVIAGTEKQKSLEVVDGNDIIEALESRTKPKKLKPLELTIRVKKESWFNLVIDGEEEQDFILPENTGKTFRGDLKFKITVGNREGVQLALNGNILNLPESEDNVLRDFLIEPGTSG